MTDETPKKATPKTDAAKKAATSAMNAADTAKVIAEGTGNAISAIKWVAIAIVMLVLFGSAVLVYKIISAPAKAVGNASKAVTESVKTGASSVKDGTADILNRLVIPTDNQAVLNASAEAAFVTLNTMSETMAEGMKEKIFQRANFSGSENKVCDLAISFGGEAIPILIAADNKAYAASKALGSDKNRLIKLMLRAPGDDIALQIEWDDDSSNWVSKWRATTVKKSLEDDIAANRIQDVLTVAARDCGG